MLLQKLVGNIYSVFIEVLLWLIPIICVITGITFGIMIARDLYLNGNIIIVYIFIPLAGLLAGLIAGFLIDVIWFGPIIVLLNMRSSLKNIEK